MHSSPSTPVLKYIVDSPYCMCGDIEDTHYFLSVCNQLTDLRRTLKKQRQKVVDLILTFYSVMTYH